MPRGPDGGGGMGLLGQVRRRVIPGEGVLRHQQADRDDVPPAEVQAAVVEQAGEDVLGRQVMVGREGEHRDDDEHAGYVPPHADVVQPGDQLDAELVQHAMQPEDDREDEDRFPVPEAEAELQVQERVDEERGAEVDPGGHRDLADEVEPAGEPGPGRAVLRRELGRPVVQAARGRVAGANLGHGQADQQRHHADAEPAPDDDRRAAEIHAEVEQGQAAGQDRDDGERDGEVREARHPPDEFLGVAELVQLFFVAQRRRGRLIVDRHD